MRDSEERRLREVRTWLMVNAVIFVVTAPSLHFTRWDSLDYKGKTALLIQAGLQILIIMGLVGSFLGQLMLIYPILLL